MRSKNNPQPDDLEAVGHAQGDGEATDAPPGAGEAMAKLRAERDELTEKYQRSLADFRNYQQRALSNEREARKQGVTDVLQGVIRVLDHFDLALGQDPAKASAAQILGGVKMIREELLRAIVSQGVKLIEAVPNDEFDPHLHSAVQEIPAIGVDPGNVSMMLQAGYLLGDRVLRPAQVAVAPRAPEPRPVGE